MGNGFPEHLSTACCFLSPGGARRPSEFQPATAQWLDVGNKQACAAAATSFSTLEHGIAGVTDVASMEFPIGCYYRCVPSVRAYAFEHKWT